MAGKIYGVGVGPGDPELLTIKAARLIKNAGVIGIPAEHKETCKAYQIAAGAVEEIREKEVVPFPFLMTRDPERLKETAWQKRPQDTWTRAGIWYSLPWEIRPSTLHTCICTGGSLPWAMRRRS